MGGFFICPKEESTVSEFKTICEIADEYERNLAALRRRRAELDVTLTQTTGYELRRKLIGRMKQLDAMISSGQMDVYLMHKYWGNEHG